MGIDDSAGAGDGVIFKISGDGKTLFESGVMKQNQPPKAVDIELKGVKRLVLAVNLVGEMGSAHADWADAHFLVSAPSCGRSRRSTRRGDSDSAGPAVAAHQRRETLRRPSRLALLPHHSRHGPTPHDLRGGKPAGWPERRSPDRPIAGTLDKPGRYAVEFQASNALGTARRKFNIVCGDTLALTPEMGWNSWYYWTGGVSDKVMRDAADAMVASGMINHGYIYVNIDDCWAKPGSKTDAPRDTAGKVNANRASPT